MVKPEGFTVIFTHSHTSVLSANSQARARTHIHKHTHSQHFMLAATSSQDQWFQSGRRSQSLRGAVGQYFQNINTNFTESSYVEWGVSMDACFCGWGERVCYIYVCALIWENTKEISFCNLSSIALLIAGGDAWIIIVGHGKSTSTLSVKVHWAGQTMWKKLVLQMRTSSILSVHVFIEQEHASRNSEILADSVHTLQKNSWLSCWLSSSGGIIGWKARKRKRHWFQKSSSRCPQLPYVIGQ